MVPRVLPLLLLVAACSPATNPPPGDDDAGTEPADGGADGGGLDAGLLPGCSEDNADASVAGRGGFKESCSDPVLAPTAQCGDGSPLKLAWREAADGGEGLLLYFRGAGRCDGYVTCWGRDGKGGVGRTVAGLDNLTRTSPPASALRQTAHGFFDRDEPQNPFAGFAVVYAPDCTGDLGARDEGVDFSRPLEANLTAPSSVRVYFRGARDVDAAVALAQARFSGATRVVLAGTGEGAYFALAALSKVAAAWPAPAALAFVFDGEAAVGRDALEQQVLAALAQYDGKAGRRPVRFVQLGFSSDPVQRVGAPVGFNTTSTFQPALAQVLAGRAAAAPDTWRAFTVPLACHGVAMSAGLYQQYVAWSGGLRPVLPTTRPNPDLSLDGGVAMDAWLAEALGGSGPFDAGFAGRAGDFSAVSTDCPLPEGVTQ